VGAAHYKGSAKALAEEGIDPRVRLRAIPMAVSFTMRGVPHIPLAYSFLAGEVLVRQRHYAAIMAREPVLLIAMRCVAMQFRALAVSTAACGVLGVAGFVALHAGLPVRSESRVSSWQDAVALARRERVSLRSQMHVAPQAVSGRQCAPFCKL